MRPRTKKLIATVALLPYLTLYLAGAAALGERAPKFWAIQLAYYLVAGLAWALPLKHVFRWINADPSQPKR